VKRKTIKNMEESGMDTSHLVFSDNDLSPQEKKIFDKHFTKGARLFGKGFIKINVPDKKLVLVIFHKNF
jgi:hypothetical protein